MAAPQTPWSRAELLVAAGANLVGFALLLIAFAGSSETDTFNAQIGWLNAAVVALVVGFAADAGLFFVARRSIGRRRLRVRPDLVAPAAVLPQGGTQGPWVWLPGTARAHRPTCQMVLGKRPVPADADLIRAQRLLRCEVCEC